MDSEKQGTPTRHVQHVAPNEAPGGTPHVATPPAGPIATPAGVVAPEAPPAEPESAPTSDEPTITVKAHTEFWNDGKKRVVGEEFPIAHSRAIAASRYVNAFDDEGKPISVRQAIGQGPAAPGVQKADIAGRPKHERVDELRREKQQLEARLADVDRTLSAELESVKAEDAAPVEAKPEPAAKK